MNGIRFYLEYKNKAEKNKATRKKLGKHKGTVVAVFYNNSWLSSYQTENFECNNYKCKYYRQVIDSCYTHCPNCHKVIVKQVIVNTVYAAIGGLFTHENSVVCSTSAGRDYLDNNCKRISEKLARKIHPALFEYLDSVD